MGVWQGVAMDSLKFHPGPPWPTLLRSAGGPPLKRHHGHLSGGPPAGRLACGCLLPFWTPHAVRLWNNSSNEEGAVSRVRQHGGRTGVEEAFRLAVTHPWQTRSSDLLA
jgi:hypothetical protein